MRILALLLLVLSGCSSPSNTIDQFSWLTGKWERTNGDSNSASYEVWDRKTDGLKGLGVTIQNSDTVFKEGLSIIKKDQNYFYVAEVAHNDRPTYFKITSISKDGFTCENPEHDFPKKIDYKIDRDTMTATISGNGKSIPFVFKKVE